MERVVSLPAQRNAQRQPTLANLAQRLQAGPLRDRERELVERRNDRIARSAIGVVNGPVPRTASASNPAGLLIASCMAPPATCAIAAGPSLAIMFTAHVPRPADASSPAPGGAASPADRLFRRRSLKPAASGWCRGQRCDFQRVALSSWKVVSLSNLLLRS